jgi:GDPmannose 4,6-dehydratase
VEEFLTLAAEFADLGDWHNIVEIDETLQRPTDIDELIGDSTKARNQLGWKPKMDFKDLVKSMVEHDLEMTKLTIDPVSDFQ